MADELKTIKFQMMLSPREAETIDDWRFKNRISSRAEAIRRLVQLALHSDEVAGVLALEAGNQLRHVLGMHDEIRGMDLDEENRATIDKWISLLIEENSELHERLTLLSEQADAFRTSANLSDAALAAEKKTEEMVSLIKSKGHLSGTHLSEKRKI